jgi:hypothetical protein
MREPAEYADEVERESIGVFVVGRAFFDTQLGTAGDQRLT